LRFTAIADAKLDSIPVVAITGQVRTSALGKDSFQEADIIGITTAITKYSYQPRTVAEIPLTVNNAFYIATTGRPGPVLIDLPKNVQSGTADVEFTNKIDLRGYKLPTEPDLARISEASNLLAKAQCPIILAGGGVITAGASEELVKMSDLLMAKYLPAEHLKSLDEQICSAETEIAEAEKKLQLKDTPKLQTALSQAKEKKERLGRLKESAAESSRLYPDGIVLSVGININTLHRGWTVYGGSRSVLRELNANYAITYEAIKRFTAKGMEFMDFFGTVPNPTEDNPLYGIHRFKKKFSGRYIEFPGEFHLVFDKTRYLIWMKLFPPVFKILKNIRKRVKR